MLRDKEKLAEFRRRFFVVCGVAALAAGYVTLLGTLAEEFSEQVVQSISIVLCVIITLTLLMALIVMGASILVLRKDQSGTVKERIVLSIEIVIVLACAVVLLWILLGSGVLLFQLSLGQFLFGNDEIQYRHLIILSGYAGAAFAFYGCFVGRQTRQMGWAICLKHGARVFVETAFLAYAGLWLFKDPFELMLKETNAGNFWFAVIAMLGMMLIFAGSISLMFRQSQAWSDHVESSGQTPFLLGLAVELYRPLWVVWLSSGSG